MKSRRIYQWEAMSNLWSATNISNSHGDSSRTMHSIAMERVRSMKNASVSIIGDHVYDLEYQSGLVRQKISIPFDRLRTEKFCGDEGMHTRVSLHHWERTTILDYYPSEVLGLKRTYINKELVRTERWDKDGQFPENLLYRNGECYYHSGWEGNAKVKKFNYKNKKYYHNYQDGKLFWRHRILEKVDGAKHRIYINGKLTEEAIFDGRLELERKYYNENGMMYSVRVLGAFVSMKYYLNPQDIPVSIIIKEQNASIRRAYLRLLGYGSFLQKLGGASIHKDGDYELIKVNIPANFQPMLLLKVLCPSTGVYYTLRVPPNMRICKEAVAWTFSMIAEEYKLAEEA